MDGRNTPADLGLPNGLGQPALRALHAAGIWRIDDLTRFSEADVARMHGIGPRAMLILRSALRQRGLTFAEEHKQT